MFATERIEAVQLLNLAGQLPADRAGLVKELDDDAGSGEMFLDLPGLFCRDQSISEFEIDQRLGAVVGGIDDFGARHPTAFVVQPFFPARFEHRLAVFGKGAVEEAIAHPLRFFKDDAAGIDKGGQGGDHRQHLAALAVTLQQFAAVGDRVEDRSVALEGEPDHEEEVDAPAMARHQGREGLLQLKIVEVLAEGVSDLQVVGFGGEFDIEVLHALGQPFDERAGRGVKEFKGELVGDVVTA